MAEPRDVLITGIGLASSLGEGIDAHWTALDQPSEFRAVVDESRFAPYPVHPMVPLELDRQVPRRGDQRQMEPWQRIGTYATGLALDSAGLKGDAERLAVMDMVVAAGGGERDYAVDTAVLSDLRTAAEPEVLLNQRLTADLRPTLFLAQLSNLLAGNIAIVQGVVGSSRTFMGEEAAGIDAMRVACAKIAAGQSDSCLVGGAYNAERADVLLLYEMGRALWKGPFQPVWARQEAGGGMVLGSLGCFLVLESREHAAARGARAFARVAAVASDWCRRRPGEAVATCERMVSQMPLNQAGAAVLSGSSGLRGTATAEREFLDRLELPVRAVATALGHSLEPSFPASIALAAIAINKGRLFGPLEAAERPMEGALRQVLVTGWGHRRGEGLALVEPA
jgi:3-oxoacyl-[acyl-carrier-protein] synthase II